jgi:hypothetical protein
MSVQVRLSVPLSEQHEWKSLTRARRLAVLLRVAHVFVASSHDEHGNRAKKEAPPIPTRAYGVSPILGCTVDVSTEGLNRGRVFCTRAWLSIPQRCRRSQRATAPTLALPPWTPNAPTLDTQRSALNEPPPLGHPTLCVERWTPDHWSAICIGLKA